MKAFFVVTFLLAALAKASLLLVGAPTAVAWRPTSQGNTCSFWLDPTDTATITKDGSNLVSQWTDKCHNAYTFTQSTGANKPTYTTNAVNSLAAMATGASTAVKGPSNLFVSTGSAWTIAGAGKLTAYNNHYGFIFGFNSGSTSQYFGVFGDSTQGATYNGLNFGPSVGLGTYAQLLWNSTISTNTVFKFVVTYSGSTPGSTASYEIWWNGTSRTISTGGGGWGNSADGGAMIGCPLTNDTGYGMSGFVGDMMFFSEKSTALTTNINTYLARWGV